MRGAPKLRARPRGQAVVDEAVLTFDGAPERIDGIEDSVSDGTARTFSPRLKRRSLSSLLVMVRCREAGIGHDLPPLGEREVGAVATEALTRSHAAGGWRRRRRRGSDIRPYSVVPVLLSLLVRVRSGDGVIVAATSDARRHEDRKAPLKRFTVLASSLLLAGSIFFGTGLPGAASAASPDRGRSESRSFSIDARAMLRTYAAAVDGRLSAALTGLAAVAATDDAASGQWARLRGPLTTVSGQVTTNAAIWFARPSGSYYTVQKGLAGLSLADRAYFPRLMAGHDVFGDLVVSKSTGKRSCIVAVPIRAHGHVIGALGASIDLLKLSQWVNTVTALPATMVFYALNAKGETTLHRQTANIFAFPSDMGSPTLKSAVRTMLRSSRGSVTYVYGGTRRTVVFQRFAPTGWIFALGAATP